MDGIGSAPLPARYKSLDAWRGFACLSVVLVHVFSLPNDLLNQTGAWSGFIAALNSVVWRLWVGVPIFFVISGYCIGAAADAHRRYQRPIHEFFVGRLRRIYLPYFAALALTSALAGAFDMISTEHRMSDVGIPNPASLSLGNWIGNITLTEGLMSGIPGHVLQHQPAPAWTLCHEVQFYAISGVFLLFASRYFFTAVGAFTVVGAAGVALAARAGFHLPQGSVLRGTWLMFAMGLAVYWQVAAGTRRARWLTLAMIAVPLLWCLGHPQSLITPVANTNQTLFVAAITALLLVVLHPFDHSLSSRAIAVPFAKLGKISFSVYLIHFPVTRFCDMQRTIWLGHDMAVALLVLLGSTFLSVWAGALFYRLVERRTLGRSGKEHAQWKSTDLLSFRVPAEGNGEQNKLPVYVPRSPQGELVASPEQQPNVAESMHGPGPAAQLPPASCFSGSPRR
jgi:peptidoglycan/LPS O-acetylase OafA/YrhL